MGRETVEDAARLRDSSAPVTSSARAERGADRSTAAPGAQPASSRFATATWVVATLAIAAAIASVPGVTVVQAALALLIIYLSGYVTGALLLDPEQTTGPATAIIRLIAGLLLTAVAFLFSLLVSIPWFAGPMVLVGIALLSRGVARSCALPPVDISITAAGALTAVVSAALLAPSLISALLMAPGDYPPVFFNVDTPYFLEKVHALLHSTGYPPPSLSFTDGRLSYHFGIQGLAAFISRSSGLRPHHAVFLIVVPLVIAGVLAAAVALAKAICPKVPSFLSVPLLLVSIPADPMWDSVGRRLIDAFSSGSIEPLRSSAGNYELWNAAFMNAHNIAAHFIVLAALCGIAMASSWGWRVTVFLIGAAMLVKSPAAVALVAGFAAAQATRAVGARSVWPLMPACAAVVAFLAVYVAFWVVVAIPSDYTVTIGPMFFTRYLAANGGLPGFAVDIVLLMAPALTVLAARVRDSENDSLPLLAFAAAPLLIVSVTRITSRWPIHNLEDNWAQIMLPFPVLAHAFVLSVAGSRWTRLGVMCRSAFALTLAITLVPAGLVAARYCSVLLTTPTSGHEFVDNRPLAEALQVIPTAGTVIVTNDLRYPAEGFVRDNRQMQIPALFGHQAFAVNYEYEVYSFSAERRSLQTLLTATEWTEAINEAARQHHWTHFVVRKDYPHPQQSPLKPIFGNSAYTVFEFEKW